MLANSWCLEENSCRDAGFCSTWSVPHGMRFLMLLPKCSPLLMGFCVLLAFYFFFPLIYSLCHKQLFTFSRIPAIDVHKWVQTNRKAKHSSRTVLFLFPSLCHPCSIFAMTEWMLNICYVPWLFGQACPLHLLVSHWVKLELRLSFIPK